MSDRELEIAVLQADLADQRTAGLRPVLASPEFDGLIAELKAVSASLDHVVPFCRRARLQKDPARVRTEAAHWVACRDQGDDCA